MDYIERDFSLLQNVQPRVTREMNSQLMCDYTVDKVYSALKQLNPAKAPGPNDMASLFYQKYWKVVGLNISKAVLHALRTGMFPCELNLTHIVLVLKKKNLKNGL